MIRGGNYGLDINYKRRFEQFFERMSDLTRGHVEAEMCFDLMSREHVADV